jgi:pyruvate carboxylase
MAGIGRPVANGKLVAAIKKKYPHIKVQYHGHSGPGFAVASMLEVAKAGADYIDVAMEPLSWGMVHPDVITIKDMLDDAGFEVPEINMNAYMEARALTQEFIDDFLGYFIDPKNRYLSSLMIDSGLPGGMMGSLMADLKGVHQGINMALEAAGQRALSEDELLIKLFDEVTFIWPLMGYPPLVTPFSQYVKNTALVNVLNLAQGKERFEQIDANSWDMLLGKAGDLPGKIDPVFEKLAKEQKREFYKGVPQDAYPDVLDKYRTEMQELGWETGPDDEELFEFAMHETQYRDYKSGIAKKRFEEEIAKFKSPKKSVVVKESQTPNRSGYSKKEATRDVALTALLLYSLNTRKLEEQMPWNKQHDVWNTIGYWRNRSLIPFKFEDKEIEVEVLRQKGDDVQLLIEGNAYDTSFVFIDKGEVDFTFGGEAYFAKITAGEKLNMKVVLNGKTFVMRRMDLRDDALTAGASGGSANESNSVKSPMPGKVFKLHVKEGDKVIKGDCLLVIESMKMENRILSTKDAVVQKVNVALNDMVEASTTLIMLAELN